MHFVVWLIALYVCVDFAGPGLPGAFTFDADTSIEVVQAHKTPAPAAGSGDTDDPIARRMVRRYEGNETSIQAKVVAAHVRRVAPEPRRSLRSRRTEGPGTEDVAPPSLAA